MKIARPTAWLAAVALLSLTAGAALAGEPATSEAAGRSHYLRYCSACHGEDADGEGPVANVLTPRPPALTGLREKYGQPLSVDLVVYISGKTMPRAHGSSDMPVWGRNLGDGGEAASILWQIVRYLDLIQEPM